MRRQRVGGQGRARRRARPRRGTAPRAQPRGVRDPDERVAGADAGPRRAGASGRRARGLLAVGPRVGRGRPARRRRRPPRRAERGRRGRRTGALAGRRGARVPPPHHAARRARGPRLGRPDVRDAAGVHPGRALRGARLPERREQAMGVGAVRLDRPGRDGTRSRFGCRDRADRRGAEGARDLERRQGPLRRPR